MQKKETPYKKSYSIFCILHSSFCNAPGAKQSGSQSNHGGSLFNGRFKIMAHPHRKDRQLRFFKELAELGEKRPRRFGSVPIGGNSHETSEGKGFPPRCVF